MDVAYSLQYRELHAKHWWWRARERLILTTIEQIRGKGNPGSILDIGCGGGLSFDRLVEFGDVEGVEPNPLLVTENNPWKSKIYVCSFDRAFQPNKDYSLILMLDVLEHFSDPLTCLRRAAELLRQDGTLLITVPAFSCIWTSHDDLNRHVARYTRRSLAKMTAAAGLMTVSSRYFFHWTFPVKLLLRYKEACLGANPQIPTVPHASINRWLYRLSVAEQALFGALPLPFGSSLLAVCRR